jgi:hypothetical protein
MKIENTSRSESSCFGLPTTDFQLYLLILQIHTKLKQISHAKGI